MISKLSHPLFSVKRRRTSIVVVASAVAMVVALPGVALADFGAPVTLATGSTANPQIDMNVIGQATVVWERNDGTNDRVQARRIAGDGSVGSTKNLSPSGQDANGPQVAMNGSGHGRAVWSVSDGTVNRIKTRTVAADGTLGSTKVLSAAGQNASDPQIDDEAALIPTAVVWERSDGTNTRIQARTIESDGDLGPIKTLSDAGKDASDPQVNVDTNSRVVVVWLRGDGTSRRVQARTIDSGGTLGTTKTLSAAGQVASGPQVEAEAGQATIVWELGNRIQARQLAGDGTLGPTNKLSPEGKDAGPPQIDVDADGRSTVVWHVLSGDGDLRVQARTIDHLGAVGTTKTLTPSGQDAFNPTVGIHLFGHATITWEVGTQGVDTEIQALRIEQNGTVGATETLSGTGVIAADPDVTGDSSDPPTVVWNSDAGIQFAR
ncbi:MAG: hypothetical protein ACRDOT_01170 [Aeromicrobium sp.]